MTKCAELANLIGNINAGGGGANKNVIINGAMNVSQRGTSFTVTNEFGLDRWFCRENTDGALTFSQDSTSPDGFSKSLKVNVDTADSSIGSSQFAYLAQRIEGFNIETFAFGSSSAKTIVLSFYVRCSVTGKFGGAITNGGNDNRSFAFTYDVNSANTWERKSVTIVGDTTGTWNIDNSQEMAVFWSLGAGSGLKKGEGSWDATASVQSASEAGVELIGNASATWFLTGVQLEVGQNPTEFEHEPVERTFTKCKRYYYKSMDGNPQDQIPTSDGISGDGYHCWSYFSTTSARSPYFFHPVQMRADPTVTLFSSARTSGASSGITAYYPGSWTAVNSNGATVDVNKLALYAVTGSVTSGKSYLFAGGFQCDAEL